MSEKGPRIGVSLAGVSYVILNFEFTNEKMIPAGIRLVERNPEEEARRRLAALPTTGRGRQWMENVQMVTPENIHVTLTTEGFTPDKLQYTPRAPDQGRGGMIKYMVMLRYSRIGMKHLPEDAPVHKLEFGTEKGSGEAIIRLLSSAWGYTHAFDNTPAGKDNVSFHFVHRKEVGSRQVALVANDGYLTHVSIKTAEEMGLEFCSPDAFPLPVSEKKPGEQHVAPRGRRPHHHDNRGQGNGGDNRRHHHGGGQHKAQRHEQRRRDDRHPHREPAQRSAPTAMTPPPVVAIDDGFGGMKNALDLAMK